MKLSHALSLSATFVALGLSLHASPTPAQEAPARPNVVIIMTDDQDVDSLPVMRHLMSHPGGSWVQFTNAFTNVALCGPSRATLLTGQYAHHHGVTGNNGHRMDASNTLPVWLDAAGYETGLVGKYLNGVTVTMNNPIPGWDYYKPIRHRHVDVFSGEAVDFINRTDDPFLLFLSYRGPHKTARPPDRYATADAYVPPLRPNVNERHVADKPAYLRRMHLLSPAELRFWEKERLNSQRELLGIDDGIQSVIDALETRGVLNNTLIIFTADNGFTWGSHRKTGKLCPYEECSNVPLFIRYPGLSGNRVERSVVSNVDLTATILDYTGVAPRRPQAGRSLIPLLENPRIAWPNAVLLEREVNDYFGVRVPGWKYIEYKTGEKELYDLTADPYEMENVADQAAYRDVQTALAQQLEALLATHTISGTVRTSGGYPMAQITVTIGPGYTVTTDTRGNYSLNGLPTGTYPLTVTKPGFSFSGPAAVTVPPHAVDQNFIGTRLGDGPADDGPGDASQSPGDF